MDEIQLKSLFKQEFSKMVAVISNHFGLDHIELAEDVVSDTFLTAAETWRTSGTPVNATAWLYTVAKRKALYYFRRNKIFETKIVPELKNAPGDEMPDFDFSNEHIRDSQLQMLFAICDPAIASEAQIALALRILCGFGIDEIAEAFLTGKETINKRLFRAKEKLRTAEVKMELPPQSEIVRRLDNVLRIIYLLFSEGYYSTSQNEILRKDLCLEALRLGLSLTEYEPTNLPATNALIALMCFHASRFTAREAAKNAFILYDDQNENLWDISLIKQGMHYLTLSADGAEISSYHLEARIAYWHCIKNDTKEKWEDILALYDKLLLVNYSPAVALNRGFALYKARGARTALSEIQKLNMEDNHFYYLLLGELYARVDTELAKQNFEKAYALAKTETEKKGILEKIRKL
jgi:RNA polymerase sigma-70 factor (ECF subfamily)